MPHLSTYVGLADHSEQILAESLRAVADGHARQADVFHTCHLLADWSDGHRDNLGPAVERYSEDGIDEPERLRATGVAVVRDGEVGLLRDLQDLHLLATLTQSTWTVIAQAAQGLRDQDLYDVATSAGAGTARQISWLTTRMKQAAPQALIITP